MLEQHIGLRLITRILLIQYSDAFLWQHKLALFIVEASELEPDRQFYVRDKKLLWSRIRNTQILKTSFDCPQVTFLYTRVKWFFLKVHSISNRSRGLDSTGSILRKYKPDTGTFHCLKPLIRGLLIENFVAKWSWMRRFADWLGFCPLLGNVNERAPSHKATFEESVIRWLPLCLLNCSRLSAPCGTPCHLQGATRGKYWSFYLCVYASTFFFLKCA